MKYANFLDGFSNFFSQKKRRESIFSDQWSDQSRRCNYLVIENTNEPPSIQPNDEHKHMTLFYNYIPRDLVFHFVRYHEMEPWYLALAEHILIVLCVVYSFDQLCRDYSARNVRVIGMIPFCIDWILNFFFFLNSDSKSLTMFLFRLNLFC